MTFNRRTAITACAAVATVCGIAFAFVQLSAKPAATTAPAKQTTASKPRAAKASAARAAAKEKPAATPSPDTKVATTPPAARADVKPATTAAAETKSAAPALPPDASAGSTASAVKAGTPAPPDQKATTDPLIEPTGFTYSIDGRRDPFISLLRRGVETSASPAGARPLGLGGLVVGEITLRGTMRSHEGFVAILQGADQKAYIVRAGDKLADGTVRTISQNDMVIVQQVDDPLSLEKQREVRKVLRQIEAN